jgi:predicted PurR-regulated permease PerM
VTVWLTVLPSVVAVLILVGMIYRGGKIIADQLEATQNNTKAIQRLTERLVIVEKINVETNVIASDIQDKVGNGG